MAADNFLGLTNRVLKAFNEVPLTDTEFSGAIGFHAEAKDAINQGLFDIYSFENVEWPFLFNSLTFDTNYGIIDYTKPSNVSSIDWNSFRLVRPTFTASSVTQIGGTAVVVSPSAHNLLTGDYVLIYGADQSGYNQDNIQVTVVDSVTFTYSVDSATVSPATGTIIVRSNTVRRKRLSFVDTEEYLNTYADVADNYTSISFSTPEKVSRTQNNDFIIFSAPDRVYTVEYDAFVMPTKLVAFNDTHVIPEQYEQAIVDRALHYAYMFRDNIEEAEIAAKRALDRTRRMRKALMPVQANVNFDGASSSQGRRY